MNFGDLDFYRVAAVSPPVEPGQPDRNARRTREWIQRAVDAQVSVAVLPELGISGYTCEDLFHSRSLLDSSRAALEWLTEATAESPIVTIVGAPFAAPDGRLYNCAFVLHQGAIRGAIPKVFLPNYGEFYEKRWFASGAGVDLRVADDVLGEFRLGTRQLFELGRMTFAVEICEDLWAPIPPSSEHALAGANVIFNLSASNEWVAKAEYRRELVRNQSARLNAAYVYVSCGPGESTKDVVYGGHAIIAENGSVLAEGPRFETASMLTADVDVERLQHDRAKNITFSSSPNLRSSYAAQKLGGVPVLRELSRTYAKTPFVPDDPATVHARAAEILSVQAVGLARRLESVRVETAVIGVSGGLDSTLALLVAVEAMKRIGKPASSVLAVTMPGFGTTNETRQSAVALANGLGVTLKTVPIGPAVEQHFRDIGHDPKVYDLVYENSQARERTQILFDLANQNRGIVVGTGDLSELALGWCTYNGDHMSSYGVNVSVPKTLVQHLVRWYAQNKCDAPMRKVLEGILATVISPELAPASAGVQSTEELIGPYMLHDFFLYHYMRNGFGPRKIYALALRTFAGDFAPAGIKKWLRVFFEKFHRQQFKRTTLPPGPKVGSVSLSPRGDWRMPDEVDPEPFLKEIDGL